MSAEVSDHEVALSWKGKAISKNEMHEPGFVHGGKMGIRGGKKYQTFMDELMLTWVEHRPTAPFGNFSVVMTVDLVRLDPTNVIDPVMDALEKALIIANDRAIQRLEMRVAPYRRRKGDDIITAIVTRWP